MERDRPYVEALAGGSEEQGRTVVEALVGASQEQGRTAVEVMEGRRLVWDKFSPPMDRAAVVTQGLFVVVVSERVAEVSSGEEYVVRVVARTAAGKGNNGRENH